ncbi:MAG: pesticidal protein Cry28Aa [Winogradskyella sp.]|uniref:proton-conducting transporter transmembrane domain-containing protein n=1 Tax=Winogradskyella sp. TaxID=1883156 RepID=UPI00182B3DB7|nr:proton-conducting transporter membrane subunit [Winogradskyella sp.]MBT8246141.1 pesticidal protein Cry28Aa [Winogradskyella sp.]NNK23729.1 pesticidal protein Cry28Aa [Winogradskyella sp.]
MVFKRFFNLPNTVTIFFTVLFVANILLLIFGGKISYEIEDVFRINTFTVLIWSVVTFFGAVISRYASSYLTGFKFHTKFMLMCTGFTLSVMVFIMSNHVISFLGSWLVMGIFMAKLIGVDSRWGEAKEASKVAQRFFFTGSAFLSTGVLLLSFHSNQLTIDGIIAQVNTLPYYVTLIASIFIILAALVQSAIYPFHRWLLSAMTSPTPASALMHAGFVNGSGILLALFATLLFSSNTLSLLFIIGGLTAIVAQFTKLLQVNVKQKLACSTIAQMGFMIMQCGLGFFNAAIAHLILHGFYKAYLFLSSGEEIKQSIPQKPLELKIKPLQAVLVLIFGALGALLFVTLTGKGASLDNSIFLTLIVSITVGQATYNIVKEKSLSTLQKLVVPPVLFIAGIGVYALFYNGVTLLMADLPMAVVPLQITTVEIIFGIIFLVGFFIMKLGFYRNIPWLYVKLLNVSQPYKKTILKYKNS